MLSRKWSGDCDVCTCLSSFDIVLISWFRLPKFSWNEEVVRSTSGFEVASETEHFIHLSLNWELESFSWKTICMSFSFECPDTYLSIAMSSFASLLLKIFDWSFDLFWSIWSLGTLSIQVHHDYFGNAHSQNYVCIQNTDHLNMK